ncbi:MAG: hypothetical protein ACYTGR_02605 [Planctomycetota bacterium]|jgi:hypothetical protein
MNRTSTTRTVALAVAVVASLGAIAVGTTGSVSMLQPASTRTYELPRIRICGFGNSTVRLDTQTGEMSALRGDGTAKGTGESWERRVPAVSGQHSGMLDIVITKPATYDGVYLVDIDGTRTWLLKWVGNANGEWREVRQIR